MKFSLRVVISIPSIILVFSGCSTHNVQQREQYLNLLKPDEYPADTMITIERDESWGLGPRYRLWITGQGIVLFEGAPHGHAMRREERRVQPQQVLNLIEEITMAGLLELPDHYAPPHCESFVTDAPTVVFSIRLRGVKREVRHDTGCLGFKYEDTFFRVEALIDSIGGSKEWVARR